MKAVPFSAFVFVTALLLAAPAHAQTPVIDALSIATRTAQAAQELAQLVAQYEQLKTTYETLHRQIATGDIAAILNDPLLRNPMPGYGQVHSYLNGTGGAPGAQQFVSQNRFYQPQGSDFTATEMLRAAQGVANVQAIAQRSLQSLEQRIAGLGELNEQIDGVSSNGDIAAVNARIASEQAFVATQTAQAAQLQVMLMAQAQVNQQRIDQKMRRDAEEQARDSGGVNGGSGLTGGAGGGGIVGILPAETGVPTFVTAGQ